MAAPRKEDVRTIIMDTTERLMETNSIDNLSLAAIAGEAGISKGTLYYHYKSKEEILFDITDRYLNTQWDDFIAWTENKEKDTSFHRLMKYVIERNVYETGPRLHLIYNACIGNETIRSALIERYRKFEKIIAQKIAERVDFVSADYLAWAALLVSDGMIVQSELDNKDFDVNKFISDTENYIRLVGEFSKNLTD